MIRLCRATAPLSPLFRVLHAVAIAVIATGSAGAQTASGQGSLMNRLQKSIVGKVEERPVQPSEFSVESISIRPRVSTNMR